MMTWLIYDITDDRNRREIIRIAQKHGLYRVQKSVFLGNIEKDEVDEIIVETKKAIDLREDSVYIFPVCESDYKKATLLGLSFEQDIVKDEKPVLFLKEVNKKWKLLNLKKYQYLKFWTIFFVLE